MTFLLTPRITVTCLLTDERNVTMYENYFRREPNNLDPKWVTFRSADLLAFILPSRCRVIWKQKARGLGPVAMQGRQGPLSGPY